MCQGPKEHLCGAQAVRLGRGRRHCYPPTPPNQLKARARLLSWSTREPLKVLKQWCGMVRVGLDLPHMLDRGHICKSQLVERQRLLPQSRRAKVCISSLFISFWLHQVLFAVHRLN